VVLHRHSLPEVGRHASGRRPGLCVALAQVPLRYEPGSHHEYSFCTDVLGRVCEVVGGSSLEEVVQRRLLHPLGMLDTFFEVPAAKRARCAVLYECKPRRGVRRGSTSSAGFSVSYVQRPYRNANQAPQIMSAGGGILSYMDAGLWGTAQDYIRFCQMLLSEGLAADGTRVLKKATVRTLWRDALAPLAGRDGRLSGWHVDETEGPPWEGGSWTRCGWSPCNALLQNLRGPLRGGGGGRQATAMGLGGGGGTYWYVDAARELAAVTFTQCFGGGRTEGDDLGPLGTDCVEEAMKAVDQGRRKR